MMISIINSYGVMAISGDLVSLCPLPHTAVKLPFSLRVTSNSEKRNIRSSQRGSLPR